MLELTFNMFIRFRDKDVEKGPEEGAEGEGGEPSEPLPERKKTYQQVAAEQRLKHTQRQVDEVCTYFNLAFTSKLQTHGFK